jgi:hypothetical protein
MTLTFRRLVRLFCFLLLFGVAAFAADPAKTLIQESIFGSKSGTEKKDAALNFVASALSITEAITKKDIVDVDRFRGGLGQIIDGTVQCLNASAWAKAK